MPLRIVVIADTHMPARARCLPDQVVAAARAADMVIHAGDFTESALLDELREFPRFVGVAGNMDGPGIAGVLREREILELEGVRVAVAHGWGAPGPLPQALLREFAKDKVGVIVFGHTHAPCNQEVDGVLLFNPGSPTDTRFAPYRSYGILTIEHGAVRGEIVKL